MSSIIKIKNVTKEFRVLNRREGLKGSIKDLFSRDYKIVRAVDNISMNIEQGEIVGYLGPNGAGKSTTIKMMTGVLEPTCGGSFGWGKRSHLKQEQKSNWDWRFVWSGFPGVVGASAYRILQYTERYLSDWRCPI